ncbi:hypothetical protein [Roseateles sp.]|uniref:hypothetical protein n=1 Tax=Roseateles sp. TaxID=1971397 RepID=UPI003BACD982
MSVAPLTGVELPDGLLQDTWERMRQGRAHWPADFQQSMAHPLVSRVVRIRAALRVRRRAGVSQSSQPPRAERRAPSSPVSTNRPAVDRKRAAAADND